MKKIKIVLGLVLCACMLTACAVDGGETTPTDTAPVQTTESTQSQSVGDPLPADNKNPAVTSLGDVCPSSSTDGHYVCTNVVQFCAGTSVKPITLCAQTGCAHEDSTCQAWIGTVQQYTEYLGKLYATVVNEDMTCHHFVSKDLTSGTITTIDTWEDTEDTHYYVSLDCIADGIAILRVTKVITTIQNERPVSREETVIWRYNLESGETRVLFSGKQADRLSVLAISSKYLAVMCRNPNPDPLSEREFEAQYGENANYGRYLARCDNMELRLYNSDASVCTVIATTEKDGLIATVDPCTAYGKEVVYQCGDTMYLLNVDTGEYRALVAMENIVNYWVMDHKIFMITSNLPWYIASDPSKEISIYYADFDDGIPVKLGNGGNTQVMEFGISEEGTSFFVGNWRDGTYKISKEDFYADRYENAELITAYNQA